MDIYRERGTCIQTRGGATASYHATDELVLESKMKAAGLADDENQNPVVKPILRYCDTRALPTNTRRIASGYRRGHKAMCATDDMKR